MPRLKKKESQTTPAAATAPNLRKFDPNRLYSTLGDAEAGKSLVEAAPPVLAVNLVCQNCHHIVATMFSVSKDGMRPVENLPMPPVSPMQAQEKRIEGTLDRMNAIREKREAAVERGSISRNRDRDLKHQRVNP